MSKIEQELVAATNFKTKKDESRQAYLKRLMRTVSKLNDDGWAELSGDAQDWNNDAAQSAKDGKSINDFPDADTDVDISEEAAEEEVVPAKKDKEPRVTKRTSACHVIKMMVVKKPSISVQDLSAKLKAKNLKVSDVTVATIRSDTRDTLRVLNELDLGTFHLSEK